MYQLTTVCCTERCPEHQFSTDGDIQQEEYAITSTRRCKLSDLHAELGRHARRSGGAQRGQ